MAHRPVAPESGWILRNAIVWSKANPLPTSVQDRLSNTHEMIFLFSRSPRYFFDLDAIRVPHLTAGLRSRAGNASQVHDRPVTDNSGKGKYANADRAVLNGRDYGAGVTNPGPHKAGHALGKNPGDVWRMATAGLRQAHFATYPLGIPLRAIAAGSRPGALILDPFSGAATTGVAALQLGRRYLGIDLNPAYHDLAAQRLTQPILGASRSGDEDSR